MRKRDLNESIEKYLSTRESKRIASMWRSPVEKSKNDGEREGEPYGRMHAGGGSELSLQLKEMRTLKDEIDEIKEGQKMAEK